MTDKERVQEALQFALESGACREALLLLQFSKSTLEFIHQHPYWASWALEEMSDFLNQKEADACAEYAPVCAMKHAPYRISRQMLDKCALTFPVDAFVSFTVRKWLSPHAYNLCEAWLDGKSLQHPIHQGGLERYKALFLQEK